MRIQFKAALVFLLFAAISFTLGLYLSLAKGLQGAAFDLICLGFALGICAGILTKLKLKN